MNAKADYTHILSVETAMDGVGVGYYNAATGASVSVYEKTVRGQAEIVVPMVQQLLEDAGVTFADLNAVVTVLGPGSFTGVRLGLSVVKSFRLALDIPVFGVSTLQALARQYGAGAMVCVVLETRRSDYYVQLFDVAGIPISQGQSLEGEGVDALLGGRDDYVMIGNAVARYSGQESALAVIDPAFLARMLADFPDVLSDDLAPIYLRDADVSVSKKVQRVLAD